MPMMVAKSPKAFHYAGKRRVFGDELEVKRADVRLLTALGWVAPVAEKRADAPRRVKRAAAAPAQPEPTAPPATMATTAPPTPVPSPPPVANEVPAQAPEPAADQQTLAATPTPTPEPTAAPRARRVTPPPAADETAEGA